MQTGNAAEVQFGVYGTGRSLAASCSAGISQLPVRLDGCAVPASEYAVAEAATPPATAAPASTPSALPPAAARDRPRTPGARVAGDRASRPAATSRSPPMKMSCAIETAE